MGYMQVQHSLLCYVDALDFSYIYIVTLASMHMTDKRLSKAKYMP